MSREGRGLIGVVLWLTILLLAATAILTTYSSALMKLSTPARDPGEKALFEIFKSASELRPVVEEDGTTAYYEAYDSQGSLLGFGFDETGRGMWGEIRVAGGMDTQYRLIGVIVIEQSETPGLGARIVEKGFLDQLRELPSDKVKLEKYGGKVDAITGATISSRAVTDIIREKMEEIITFKSGEGPP